MASRRIHDARPRVDGTILKKLRLDMGWGQERLGLHVEVVRDGEQHLFDASYVSRLESGKCARRDAEYALGFQEGVKKLCAAMGVEFQQFVFPPPEMPVMRVEVSGGRHGTHGRGRSNARTASDIFRFAEAYRAFRDDATVCLVCQMLDGQHPAMSEDRTDLRTLCPESIALALTGSDDCEKAQWERNVCGALDLFLQELLFFESYLRAGAISNDELQFVGGVVGLLCGKGKTRDEELLARLWSYIDQHGFSAIRKLAERLGFAPPPPSTGEI